MAKINLPPEEEYPGELFDHLGYNTDPLLEDESELRKEISKLKRWEKKLKQEYEIEIERLKFLNRELFAKNFDLTEANNIFARGLEQLKQDQRITTESHTHHVIDTDSIKKKISELTMPKFGPDLKRRVVGIITLKSNNRNEATEVLIVTEHTEKIKKAKDE